MYVRAEEVDSQHQPPGPRGWPIVGVGPAYRMDPLSFLTRMQRQFGDIVALPMGSRRHLFFLSDPAYVEQLLVANASNYHSRDINRSAMEFLGDGLLNIDGETHRHDRTLVQPSFSRRQVESYATIMLDHTDTMLARWKPSTVVSFRHEMQRLTLGIAAQAFFGLDLRHESAAFGNAFSRIIRYRPLTVIGVRRPRWDLPITAYGQMQRARAFLDKQIYARIAERRQQPIPGDIISSLVQAGMRDEQVRDHAMTFLAAGHETTANALAFAFYLFSTHATASTPLLEELATELGKRDVGLDDLPRLPTLDRFTRESLRLYPPAWIIGRRAVADDTMGRFPLPARSFVIASQWVMHRMPRYWPAPLAFLPDRWLPPEQGGQTIVPYTYFPFGGGPRTCIGMPFAQQELRLILARILQHFAPELVPGQRLVLEPHVTLRPLRGTRMRLVPRPR